MAVWQVEHPSPDDILDAIHGASTREDGVAALVSLGLTAEQADDAIDIVGAAASRGLLLSTGMRPHQFQGDLEDDRLFLAALRRAGHTIGSGSILSSTRVWNASTFALLGVCALIVVAVVSLLKHVLSD